MIETLVKRLGKDTYIWSDGQPAPMLKDMELNFIAPNYRVLNDNVEIPVNWESKVSDPNVIKAIETLILVHGVKTDIFAENHEDGFQRTKKDIPIETAIYANDKVIGKSTESWQMHSLTKSQVGYNVPVKEWDHVMSQVVGVRWDMVDEPFIRRKIEELNFYFGKD